jgi:predicted metal-binding membrane protein
MEMKQTVAAGGASQRAMSQPRVQYWQRLSDPGVLLWTVAGVCWVALLLSGHHHQIFLLGASATSAPGAALVFAAFWLEMIGAMMLPTAVPMMRRFTAVSARGPQPVASGAAFLGGYVALWMAFAIAALAAATVIQIALGPLWLNAHPYLVLAAMLALAGAFQFSPMKDRCLTLCRDPLTFLFRHYRRGASAAFVLGLRHGLSCLGCCWALMLVMCGTGMASLLAMFLLMLVMLAEKVTRWGHRATAPIGVVLLCAALIVALFGNATWGLYMPVHVTHAMHGM